MKNCSRTIIHLFLVCVTCLLMSCGGEDPDFADNPANETVNDSSSEGGGGEARLLFNSMCANCHGSNGQGGAGGRELYQCDSCNNDDALFAFIRTQMPLQDPSLCDDDCARLLANLILNDFIDEADEADEGDEGLEETPNEAPVADASRSTGLVGSAPLTVSFDGRGSTDDQGITAYRWDFSDGETASGAQVNHTYNGEGSYTVSLTVRDSQGLTDSTELTITVSSPVVTVEALFLSTCATCHGQTGQGGIGPSLSRPFERDSLYGNVERMMQINNIGCGNVEDCRNQLTDYILDNFATQLGGEEFACTPGEASASPHWKRLTRRQYQNALRDLLPVITQSQNTANNIWSALNQEFELLPDDRRVITPQDVRGSFRRLDQTVQQAHVDSWYNIAGFVGNEVTRSGRLSVSAGSCAADNQSGNNENCLRSFIERIGSRAFRRPLTNQEITFYTRFYGNTFGEDAEGYADVVAGILNAPEFLYVVEHGSNTSGSLDSSAKLTAYELAARLSFHFWDSIPDNELWASAQNGSLLNEQAYEAQVDRMLVDSRVQGTIREFYREWLKLETVPALDRNVAFPDFAAFAGDNLPSATLRDDALNEIVELAMYHTWDIPAGISELMTTRLGAPSAELAALYGLNSWNSTGVTTLPASREGLLSRAAFLATGTSSTRPIMKGVFIRETLLCDHIPPPPANASDTELPSTDGLSTRQIVEELTEQPGTQCTSCHLPFINGLGFVSENFDALGRERDVERKFDAQGNLIDTLPVDTQATPQVIVGDMQVANSVSELTQQMLASGKVHQCLSRHYFRFSFGQWEDDDKDGCTLSAVENALVEENTLEGMLRAIALTPAFKERVYANTQGGGSLP